MVITVIAIDNNNNNIDNSNSNTDNKHKNINNSNIYFCKS